MPTNRWISRSAGRSRGSKKVYRRSKTLSKYAPTRLTRRATTKTKTPAWRAFAVFILSQLKKATPPRLATEALRRHRSVAHKKRGRPQKQAMAGYPEPFLQTDAFSKSQIVVCGNA